MVKKTAAEIEAESKKEKVSEKKGREGEEGRENKEARDWHKLILVQAKNEKWSNKNKENHGDNIPTEQAQSDNVPESITWGMYYVRHLPSSLPSLFRFSIWRSHSSATQRPQNLERQRSSLAWALRKLRMFPSLST